MDDFNINSLQESRNEWTSRLVTILVPCIFNGLKSIFDEAINVTINEKQPEKYLMTFQNLLIQIPKWNNQIINDEVERIINQSQCNYIEDLITCVHIIQLKALTCVRVGQSEKNVDINIPKLCDFIHRVYINTARTVYSNIYLFEQNILPLQIQQNYNKVDTIIKESIIESIRQSMPIDEILRSYLEDSVIENVSKTQLTTSNNELDKNTTDNIQSTIDKEEVNINDNNIMVQPTSDLFDVSSTLDKPNSTLDNEVNSQENTNNDFINTNNIELQSDLNTNISDLEDTKYNVRFSELDDINNHNNNIDSDTIKIIDDNPNINMNIEDLTSSTIISNDDDASKLLGVEVLS